jgi:hypothetical protein
VLFKLTTDKIIRRLRWVLLLAILIDGACTLIGQPPDYPRATEENEPIVGFFLERGYVVFAAAGLLYGVGIIFIISVVPRRIGLIILFTLLLAHFWGATSWLAWKFGYSIRADYIFDLCMAVLITMAIGKAKEEA